jgi:hypothetical protein
MIKIVARIPCIFLLTLAATVLGPTLALAVSYPHNGAFCRAVTGQITYEYEYGFHNSGSGSNVVICPILRQQDTNKFQNTLKTVKLTVYDRDPSSDVSCTLYVMSQNTVTWTSPTVATSGSSGPPRPPLVWTPNRGLHKDDSLVIACSIPPVTDAGGSHIASYLSIEE